MIWHFLFFWPLSHSNPVIRTDLTSGFIICDVLFPFLILPDCVPCIRVLFPVVRATLLPYFFLLTNDQGRYILLGTKKFMVGRMSCVDIKVQ